MHVRMKTFAMFQQNNMIVLEMAGNLDVSVLLVLCVCVCVVCVCVFSGILT